MTEQGATNTVLDIQGGVIGQSVPKIGKQNG